MRNYDEIAHDMAESVEMSDCPVEVIKFYVGILRRLSSMYFDRERIKVDNQLGKIEIGLVG